MREHIHLSTNNCDKYIILYFNFTSNWKTILGPLKSMRWMVHSKNTNNLIHRQMEIQRKYNHSKQVWLMRFIFDINQRFPTFFISRTPKQKKTDVPPIVSCNEALYGILVQNISVNLNLMKIWQTSWDFSRFPWEYAYPRLRTADKKWLLYYFLFDMYTEYENSTF